MKQSPCIKCISYGGVLYQVKHSASLGVILCVIGQDQIELTDVTILGDIQAYINGTYTGTTVISEDVACVGFYGTGGGDACTFIQDDFIATEGQTEFVLTGTPVHEDSVFMFINQQSVQSSNDFTLSGQTITYTGDYVIEAGDEVWFKYLDCTGTGLGSGSLQVDNGLHIDPVTGKAYFGGTLVENTELILGDKLYKISALNPSDPNLGMYEEITYDQFDRLVYNNIIGYETQIRQMSTGVNIDSTSPDGASKVNVNGAKVLIKSTGDNTIEFESQNGKYKIGNVKLDIESKGVYDTVLDEDGNLYKKFSNRQDGCFCYSNVNNPVNFVFDLTNTDLPIQQYVIDGIVGGTATGYISSNDSASFSNTGYIVDGNYLTMPYMKLSATEISATIPNMNLQTLYMPNLTTIQDPTCFDVYTGKTITLIIPSALHSDPSILSLMANNTVILIDSSGLSGVLEFKKVIQNNTVRYFENDIEVIDTTTIEKFESFIKSFGVFTACCGGDGGTAMTLANGLHLHDGVGHLGGELIESTYIDIKENILGTYSSIFNDDDPGNIIDRTNTKEQHWSGITTNATDNVTGHTTDTTQTEREIILQAYQPGDSKNPSGTVQLKLDGLQAGFNLQGGATFSLDAASGTYLINNLPIANELFQLRLGNDNRIYKQYNGVFRNVTEAERIGIDVADPGITSLTVFQTDGTQIGLHYWDGVQWNYLPSVPSI